GEVVGVVLLVAVHEDDDPAAGVAEAGADRGGLAEVAAELDDPDPWIALVPGEGHGAGGVGAAVVDEDDLGRLGHGVEHLEELRHREVDVLLLLVEGDDHGEVVRVLLGGGAADRGLARVGGHLDGHQAASASLFPSARARYHSTKRVRPAAIGVVGRYPSASRARETSA